MNLKQLYIFGMENSQEPVIKNPVLRAALEEPRTMAQAPIAEDLEPGALRDEMLKGFDPSQETHEEYLQRINLERPFNAAQGGSAAQLVRNTVDGSRPGYQGPTPGHKQEKIKFLNWLENNKDFDFANSSTSKIIEKSGTKFKESTIHSILGEKEIQTKHTIARAQDTPTYTKKVLTELRKDLPPGISIEQGRPGKYYFRIMLKGGKADKPTYRNSYVANEANKQIAIDDFNKVSKEYYPGRLTDQEFKDLRLKHKNMKTEDFAKFLDSEGKTTYLGDQWNKSSVSRLQSKLDIGVGTTGPLTIRTVDEAKKIIRQQPGAKFFFMTNPTDSQITRYAADLVSQEKLGGKGGKKGFPIGSTKENKMFRNFYDSSLKSDGRMKLIGKAPIDADGDINWKMKDKNGVPAWKKAKFYDNKKKTTFTWLDKKGNYNPGDLRKQVDVAYHEGFFAESVKTYDEQAKWNKKTFKGRALNEWMREGLLQKEFELKYKRKPTATELKEWYALRKPSYSFTEAHHIEGVGKNPFRMELSYRAANRKQNNLLKKYNAGTLTKNEYIKEMENLSDTKGGIKYKTEGRFIGQTGTPERIIATAGKEAGLLKNKDFVKFFKDTFQGLSPRSMAQLTKEFPECGTKAKGGSIMSCLQGKFKADPEKFLQRSVPLVKDNVNLRKWFLRGRNIARGTGVFAAWEAVFAPVIAGWGKLEGDSHQRILHDLFYGSILEGVGVPPEYVPGKSEKEEWMEDAGGDELAYKMKRMGELENQELPYLQQQLNDVINKTANVPGKGYQQRLIEREIEENELELQKLYNTSEFYEGPAGGASAEGDYGYNEPVIQDAYALEQLTTAKRAAERAERKKATFDWLEKNKIIANRNWQSQLASGGIASLNVKK